MTVIDVSFGGIGLASIVETAGGTLVVTDVGGRARLPWAVQLRTVAGLDGAAISSAVLVERTITVGFAALAADRSAATLQAIERALAGWLLA
ncbi:MAG: hypothetical protein LBE08_11370, partial [Bifidobacteriaceae bacterium]|nr:hypothetical protein [Bifidobacteriaceae bacterium]